MTRKKNYNFFQVKLMNVSEKIKVLDILLNKSVIIHQSLLAMLLEKIGHGLKILESRQNSGERYSFKIFTIKEPFINDITYPLRVRTFSAQN